MRKYLGLSVMVSAVLMAGGEIKPVEPVVQTEAEPDYGEIFGQARTFYIDRTYSGTTNNNRNALTTGGYIGYQSPNFSGLTFAAAAYGTYGFDIHHEDADILGAASYEPSLYGRDFDNYAFIGQAYMNYAYGNTTIKIGRQELNTPMVGIDDARMLPNLFEAAVLSNTDIENTRIIAAHVTRETVGTFGNIYAGGMLGVTSGYGLGINQALSGDFVNMGTVALGDTDLNADGSTDNSTAGVTALAAVYTGIENLKLQAWDYIAWNILNAVYLDADYAWAVTDTVKLNVAAQYINERDSGDTFAGFVNSDYFGGKIGVSYGSLSGYAAYSSTGKSDGATHGGIITPWGGMPAYTQGMVTRHQFFADTDSWKMAGAYTISAYGVSTAAYYTHFDVGAANSYVNGTAWIATEAGFEVAYDVKALKGLNVKLRANYPRDFAPGLDWDEYRLIANYNF